MSERLEEIRTDAAPAPIGPYSQAIRAGGFVACSGQIALDPASGELVGGGDVIAEAEQALANLTAVLASAGCTPADVVKTTIYLLDINDFARVGDVYARTFATEPAPARATVAVAALPKGARIEIDALAISTGSAGSAG